MATLWYQVSCSRWSLYMHLLPGMILLYLAMSILHQRCFCNAWDTHIHTCIPPFSCSLIYHNYWSYSLHIGRPLTFLHVSMYITLTAQQIQHPKENSRSRVRVCATKVFIKYLKLADPGQSGERPDHTLEILS